MKRPIEQKKIAPHWSQNARVRIASPSRMPGATCAGGGTPSPARAPSG
jgi:hypothetical protein